MKLEEVVKINATVCGLSGIMTLEKSPQQTEIQIRATCMILHWVSESFERYGRIHRGEMTVEEVIDQALVIRNALAKWLNKEVLLPDSVIRAAVLFARDTQ